MGLEAVPDIAIFDPAVTELTLPPPLDIVDHITCPPVPAVNTCPAVPPKPLLSLSIELTFIIF